MKFSLIPLAALSAFAAAAPATTQKTFDINVGNGSLIFEPNVITANPGDLVNFHFFNPGSHSVASSTYRNPCHPKGPNAIWSGYVTQPAQGESPMVWQVRVTDTEPTWIYCGTGSHCPLGMSMVINPPAHGPSLATYQQNSNKTSTVAPKKVQGGKFIQG